jgi:hypothetical protein
MVFELFDEIVVVSFSAHVTFAFHFGVVNISSSLFTAEIIVVVASIAPYRFEWLAETYKRGGAEARTHVAAAWWHVLPDGEITHSDIYSAATP